MLSVVKNTESLAKLGRTAIRKAGLGALVIAVVLGFAAPGWAQSLTGTWTGTDNTTQVTISHQGNTLRVAGWGGPKNPELRGTGLLTGGPKVFRGTWENRKGEWSGKGTQTITLIDANTIYTVFEGFVYYRGNKTPVRGAGYARRKVAVAAVDPIAGIWNDRQERFGDSKWRFTPAGHGRYHAEQIGLGNARGTATFSGNQLRIDWSTRSHSGTYFYTLDASGRFASGTNVVRTGTPGNYRASMRKQ